MTTITIPPQQGDVILHSLMSLENHWPLPNKPNTFIYDAIFSCTDSDNDGVGSFCHYIGTDKNKKQDGFYETNARIVSFKQGRNINSDEYGDEAINMQPLSVVNEDDFNYKMSVSATGVVVDQDRANATFVVHVLQYTMGSPSSDAIAVQGFLLQSGKWPNPTDRLPVLKSIVNMSSFLQRFETYTPSANHATTCAVVNIQKLCYLWKPPTKPTTTTKMAPLKRKGKMRAKMHAQAESGVEADTCASLSTLESVLAKRKDHPSEDEVDEDV
ncbi:hypothetical protein EI94DRAFT_1706626 [Lactarius quietus]|nr:hypothetical protein EI94DRAFT_1706626 [Lactarius quietus]